MILSSGEGFLFPVRAGSPSSGVRRSEVGRALAESPARVALMNQPIVAHGSGRPEAA